MKFELSEWLEVSTFNPDNYRLQETYIPQYLGMLSTIDVMAWRTDIEKIKTAKTIIDYIKLRYCPDWILRRFPATYIEFDIRVLYPSLSRFPHKVTKKEIKKCVKSVIATKKEVVYLPEIYD